MKKLTIKVIGECNTGKTRVARTIMHMLRSLGVTVNASAVEAPEGCGMTDAQVVAHLAPVLEVKLEEIQVNKAAFVKKKQEPYYTLYMRTAAGDVCKPVVERPTWDEVVSSDVVIFNDPDAGTATVVKNRYGPQDRNHEIQFAGERS